ncbi:PREDICTED: ER membrane protein complex subunit 7 homolog [Priapulus caudatus]|uniref:ER membrane protein complex subunit 7 homolog n=1 Tax=Priapulus caudatus TaxID=37621 RepID=A0ABM1EE31_PRICU|nr:PREDICTED: ER membrane protein complex subunit 7 homolog [Priapulus caudatus]
MALNTASMMENFVDVFILLFTTIVAFAAGNDTGGSSFHYSVEGKVPSLQDYYPDWTIRTRILVNGGQYVGFLKHDGSFQVQNLASGSYVFEVDNADFDFEPVRVDINSKGKIRARKVNYIQSSQVNTVQYPLKFRLRGVANYFQKRETWRITDMLMNPMVLMMVAPLLLMVVLPKLTSMQDPESQKEMQDMQQQIQQPQMPDIAEKLTSLFGDSRPKSIKAKKVK